MDKSLLAGLLVHTGLYSLYIVLFGLALYIHLKKQTPQLWIHLAFLSLPFIFSTIAYVASMYEFAKYLVGRDMFRYSFAPGGYEGLVLWPLTIIIPEGTSPVVRICYILSNLMADLYITYRCFLVWGRSWKVVIAPLALIITTLVAQIGVGGTDWVLIMVSYGGGVILTFVTNVLVTGLTAGRIWWVGRQASALLPHKVLGKYRRTMQIVLESGLLYPASLAALVGVTQGGVGGCADSFTAASLCIVNIAPTLIIIRVGLGVSVDDVATTVQTFNAAPRSVGAEESQIFRIK